MSQQPFTTVCGPAAPLLLANIDTDVIIRMQHLAQTPRNELGRHAMHALRYLADGTEEPQFVLNRGAFREAPILLAGPNFGCGSSREHAVWALQGRGVRCIIAPSFGDIFYGNCFQNGLLPIRFPLEIVLEFAHQCGDGQPLSVDLRNSAITTPDGHLYPFFVDPQRRQGLLRGLDDIEVTLRDEVKIIKWQAADLLRRPWAWPQLNLPKPGDSQG